MDSRTPQGGRQSWGLHPPALNPQEAGWAWLSPISCHMGPTPGGLETPTSREGPTYLPAISTLVADDEGGHGLIRAAGLHLRGERGHPQPQGLSHLEEEAPRCRSSLELQRGEATHILRQCWPGEPS